MPRSSDQQGSGSQVQQQHSRPQEPAQQQNLPEPKQMGEAHCVSVQDCSAHMHAMHGDTFCFISAISSVLGMAGRVRDCGWRGRSVPKLPGA
mmetsp:Transcript_56788/g.161196  ORF Transcript_56788/g.161196 Transcript_56788/m.161196 type:complete len:92 (-) Transcript_56788:25-300(-)